MNIICSICGQDQAQQLLDLLILSSINDIVYFLPGPPHFPCSDHETLRINTTTRYKPDLSEDPTICKPKFLLFRPKHISLPLEKETNSKDSENKIL